MAGDIRYRKLTISFVFFSIVMLFLITESDAFVDAVRINLLALNIHRSLHDLENMPVVDPDDFVQMPDTDRLDLYGQASPFRLIGSFFVIKGDYDGARGILEKAVLVNPNDIFVNFFLGRIYLSEQDDQKAIDAFQKSGAASYLLFQATNRQKAGDPDEAIHLFTLAKQVDPSLTIPVLDKVSMASAYYDIGEVKRSENELLAAVNDIEHSREPDWVRASVYGSLGDFYFRRGFYGKARDQYLRAIDAAPENDEFKKSIGVTYLYLNHLDLAEKFLLLASDSDYLTIKASAYYHLGVVSESHGDQAQAINYYKLSSSLLPDNIEYHLKLADAYIKGGQVIEGISEYRLLLKLDPGNQSFTMRLNQLESKLKDPENPKQP